MASTPWRLSLFGTVGLHSESSSLIDFETKRAAKILVLLSFSRSGKLRRDELADLLWPDDFIDSTRLRLRQELSRLRRGIGEAADIIQASTDDVSIDKSQIMDDLDRLAQPDSINPDEMVKLLTEPFLGGWDDPWVIPKRLEADNIRVSAAMKCAKKLLVEKHPAKALQVSRAALCLRSQNEDIVKLAMQAHTDLGSLSEAVIEFRRFKRQEFEPTELNPLSIPIQSLVESSEFLVPQLPNPIDKFYGRDELVLAIRTKAHSPDTRLITLVGPGGIGKTRLSIEALRNLEKVIGFISFVECLPDQSPESFIVAKVMDGVEVPDPIEGVNRILAAKSGWLVLDNLEHLRDPGGFVARLLSANPKLKLMVTSRRPMKVSGEDVIAVGPLEMDEEAIPMLFGLIENRKSVSNQIEQFREIVELCGGFPLTLRLAASRLRILEPIELIHDIKESTTSLQANLADLPSRHRNFNDMLQVSFDSLSDIDRQTLLKIACFPGGVTRAITRSLVGSDVDNVLDRLLDSSLIWLDDETSPMRFQLLVPVRQFIQQLDLKGSSDKLNRSFIKCMREIAATMTPGWKLPPDSETALFRREVVNLHAAINLAFEVDHESAHVIFEKVWNHELGSGRRSNLFNWANRLESLSNLKPLQKGHIDLCRAWCNSAAGQLELTAEIANRARSNFESANAMADACFAWSCAFESSRHSMTWKNIEQEYEEILSMAQNVAPEYVATIRTFRGMVLSYRDEWDRAQEDLEYGFECAKKAGNLGLVFLSGTTLLIIDYGKGRLESLPKRIEELTNYIAELDDAHYESNFRRAEAYIEFALGKFDRAEIAARKGRSVSSFVRHPVHEVEVRLILCRALMSQGKLREAKEVFEEIFPDIDSCLRRVKVVALVCLAELKLLDGDLTHARLLCSIAKEYRDHLGLRTVIFESEYLSARFESIGTDPVELEINDELVDSALMNKEV